MVVTEREVLACIRAGAGSVDAVGQACEAGTGCGACRGGIAVLLSEQRARAARRSSSLPEAVLAQIGLFAARPGDEDVP